MRELSFWEQRSLLPASDVIVIGAGIVGLTAARVIAEKNPRYTVSVLEKDIIGSTASSRNAGFACFGSVSEILADLDTMDQNSVVNLIQTRKEGLKMLTTRYGAKNLNLNICGGYELYEDGSQYESDLKHLNSINNLISSQRATFESRPTPPNMRLHSRCFVNKEEGHLDTGLLYKSLVEDSKSSGVHIHRGIEVIEINEQSGHVELEIRDLGRIRTSSAIVATNALTKRLIPTEAVIPARNQVLVTTPIPNHNLHGTFHMDAGYIYFRDIKDRILIGGARHLFGSETTDQHGINKDNIQYLKTILEQKILPNAGPISVEMNWSGIIAPKPSKLPIVKKYSDRITLGVRLGGMGVAIGMKIGEAVATLSMS